ncbi:MAG: Uma2 family endonuclease [Bacteroidales bacterium]|nr:Uma2 family endonuclease [Bacteroidales bacterium]
MKKIVEENQKRLEFYEKITPSTKAEFINGKIIVHSPVMLRHNRATLLFSSLLNNYVVTNNLGYVGVEKILIKLTRNDFEPDICFFKNQKAKDFTDDQMFFPAPDFVVEILSKSTEKNDRGVKFVDYAIHGVGEYWIIDPEKEFVEQYVLKDEEYELIKKTNDGKIKNSQIEGFEIPVRAIFDEKENLKALNELK